MTISPRPSTATQFVLRACDLAIALPMLALLALPMAIIALAIWAEDRDSVLFRQIRVGQGTRRFQILKFRTMYSDPSRVMGHEHAGAPSADARAAFSTTVPGDPRITRIGQVLRPTHLDELPQLLNVLRGDMSLVGVRPDVPVQEADYTPEVWEQRHWLRPGITGFAQVDSTIASTAERTAQDLRWVCEASLLNYVQTLVRTVAKVARRNSL